MHKWTVSEEAENKSIFDFISEQFPDEDKKGAKRLIEEGIRLNGMAVKSHAKLSAGDILELYTENSVYSKKTSIVYEDENLMIFDKQQDVSCYTNRDDKNISLYDIAVEHMKRNDEFNMDTYSLPYICHGLDITTGGLVIVAKDEIIYKQITNALKERRIRKFYKCIVEGNIEEPCELQDYMMVTRDKFAKLQTTSKPQRGSAPIYLRYRPLESIDNATLLEVEMITDHISQICAQLAMHSIFVLGDDVYGDKKVNRKLGLRKTALWADKLCFEVGKRNPLEYLDNTFIESADVGLPYFPFKTSYSICTEEET